MFWKIFWPTAVVVAFRSDGFIPNILHALQAHPHCLPIARCDLRMVLLKTFGMFQTANPFVNLRLVKAIL